MIIACAYVLLIGTVSQVSGVARWPLLIDPVNHNITMKNAPIMYFRFVKRRPRESNISLKTAKVMSSFVTNGSFMFVVFRLTREFFTHLGTSPLPWRGANFDLCSALMAIEQWVFFSVPHVMWHGHPFLMVISEDPWHSHLMPSVWQWSCHNLF